MGHTVNTCVHDTLFNRTATGQARFLINRAAMGQAWFLIYFFFIIMSDIHVEYIFFGFIEALDLKRILNTLKIDEMC